MSSRDSFKQTEFNLRYEVSNKIKCSSTYLTVSRKDGVPCEPQQHFLRHPETGSDNIDSKQYRCQTDILSGT